MRSVRGSVWSKRELNHTCETITATPWFQCDFENCLFAPPRPTRCPDTSNPCIYPRNIMWSLWWPHLITEYRLQKHVAADHEGKSFECDSCGFTTPLKSFKLAQLQEVPRIQWPAGIVLHEMWIMLLQPPGPITWSPTLSECHRRFRLSTVSPDENDQRKGVQVPVRVENPRQLCSQRLASRWSVRIQVGTGRPTTKHTYRCAWEEDSYRVLMIVSTDA